jgi:hypothetical protein
MDGKIEEARTDRRGFLKFAGLGTVAGGAALVTGSAEPAQAAKPAHGQGYRETEHVKTYYATARF